MHSLRALPSVVSTLLKSWKLFPAVRLGLKYPSLSFSKPSITWSLVITPSLRAVKSTLIHLISPLSSKLVPLQTAKKSFTASPRTTSSPSNPSSTANPILIPTEFPTPSKVLEINTMESTFLHTLDTVTSSSPPTLANQSSWSAQEPELPPSVPSSKNVPKLSTKVKRSGKCYYSSGAENQTRISCIERNGKNMSASWAINLRW